MAFRFLLRSVFLDRVRELWNDTDGETGGTLRHIFDLLRDHDQQLRDTYWWDKYMGDTAKTIADLLRQLRQDILGGASNAEVLAALNEIFTYIDLPMDRAPFPDKLYRIEPYKQYQRTTLVDKIRSLWNDTDGETGGTLRSIYNEVVDHDDQMREEGAYWPQEKEDAFSEIIVRLRQLRDDIDAGATASQVRAALVEINDLMVIIAGSP